MAGGKLPPRQKMIGMMYLVLTALLAMNVSKEIIQAFVVMNTGLENTNKNSLNKNGILYAAFESANAQNPVKTKKFFDAAQVVRKNSNELVDYIKELKADIIAHAQLISIKVADTFKLRNVDKLDDYDTPTHFMVGSDPANVTGKSKDLHAKIDEYKRVLLSMLDAKDAAAFNIEGLSTKGSYNTSEEKVVSWEWYNFYHLPVAAAVANLTKIQNDVRNAEGDAVNLLLKNVTAADFKFDAITAKVIAPSSYVIQGEDYNADVFVAAFSTTQNPTIILGTVDTVHNTIIGAADSTSIKVSGGIGKYSVKPTGVGLVDWSGLIRVQAPDGSHKNYPFKSSYRVAPPSVSVSPDKMNVFYESVENPVTVSAAGFANEDLIVGGSGVQMVKSGKGYIARPTLGQSTCTVNVSAKTSGGGTKAFPPQKFRIKQVPTPVGMVIKKTGDQKVSKGELANTAFVEAYLEGFDFELPFPVVSFDLTTAGASGLLETKSASNNMLTADQKKMVGRGHPGQRFSFENMRVKMPNGKTKAVPGVNFTVK
jgi:gliding motility-associated protein GldM